MTDYIPHNLGDLFTEEIYNKSKLSNLGRVDKIENIQILNDISHDINISPLAFHAMGILLKYGFINCKDYNVSEIASIIAMSEILSKDVQFEVNRLLKAIEDLLKSAGLDRFINNLFAFKNGERVQLSYEETKRIGIVKTDLEKYLSSYGGDLQKCKSKIEDNVVLSADQNLFQPKFD
ncbi:hypothetical protein Anas_05360 [Armadillidium nasatum]|uniref:Uncharacterized protein n=1 Tax=Armadillidium nasatum TaxID=96803 RepID=A0A5N5SMV0_9CRUS|nr:hypothetical protein Anas_05360 [Armadillidium nasatum]